jgi:hypothetical protein
MPPLLMSPLQPNYDLEFLGADELICSSSLQVTPLRSRYLMRREVHGTTGK